MFRNLRLLRKSMESIRKCVELTKMQAPTFGSKIETIETLAETQNFFKSRSMQFMWHSQSLRRKCSLKAPELTRLVDPAETMKDFHQTAQELSVY